MGDQSFDKNEKKKKKQHKEIGGGGIHIQNCSITPITAKTKPPNAIY